MAGAGVPFFARSGHVPILSSPRTLTRAPGCVTAFVVVSLNKQWTLPENDDHPTELGTQKPGNTD